MARTKNAIVQRHVLFNKNGQPFFPVLGSKGPRQEATPRERHQGPKKKQRRGEHTAAAQYTAGIIETRSLMQEVQSTEKGHNARLKRLRDLAKATGKPLADVTKSMAALGEDAQCLPPKSLIQLGIHTHTRGIWYQNLDLSSFTLDTVMAKERTFEQVEELISSTVTAYRQSTPQAGTVGLVHLDDVNNPNNYEPAKVMPANGIHNGDDGPLSEMSLVGDFLEAGIIYLYVFGERGESPEDYKRRQVVNLTTIKSYIHDLHDGEVPVPEDPAFVVCLDCNNVMAFGPKDTDFLSVPKEDPMLPDAQWHYERAMAATYPQALAFVGRRILIEGPPGMGKERLGIVEGILKTGLLLEKIKPLDGTDVFEEQLSKGTEADPEKDEDGEDEKIEAKSRIKELRGYILLLKLRAMYKCQMFLDRYGTYDTALEFLRLVDDRNEILKKWYATVHGVGSTPFDDADPDFDGWVADWRRKARQRS